MDYQHPSRSTEVIAVIVRLLGLLMLVIGLIISIKVIVEAWALYEEPQRIERFAEAIDQGSNLDQLLRSFSQKTASTETEFEAPTSAATTSQQPTLRVSYFLAWIIALVLLMVIGGLAASAIRTGGQLALYDLQVKRFANEFIKQAQKSTPKQD
jgi:disulfide bond formation protein DsbB